jgi:hypothetical protein
MKALENQASAADVLAHLNRLHLERVEAKLAGLADCATYMSELDEEIAHCRSVFVGAAVTEIAVLRGELSGRLEG